MVGFGAALTLFSGIVSIFKDSKDIAKDIKDAQKQFKYIKTNGSMTSVLSKFIVEPVAIISKDLMSEPMTDKILETNINLFASYYSQVFKILTEVNGLDSEMVIDVLSTDTKIMNQFSKESYPDYVGDLMGNKQTLSVEAAPTANVAKDRGLSSIIEKVIDLEISVSRVMDGQRIKHVIRIPIVIKLYVVYANIDSIMTLVEPYSKDKTFSSRLDDYRSGAISLMDLIFAGDLIKQYKQNRLKNNNQLQELINNRKMTAGAKGLSSGIVGFEKYYNMLILSTTARKMIEGSIRGSLEKDAGARDTVFDGTSSLMITDVDQDYERIRIYTKDITGSTSVSFKALSKGDKNDFSEFVKLFMNNRPPVL